MCQKLPMWAFLPLLGTLEALKLYKNIFSQDFPQHFLQNFPQDFLQDFQQHFLEDFLQHFLQYSHKISHTISHTICQVGCWLVSSPLPIPNAKFPPITALLNRPTYHKSANVSPPPIPKSHGNPKSMNKLTLNEPAMKHERTQWKCFIQTHLLFVTYAPLQVWSLMVWLQCLCNFLQKTSRPDNNCWCRLVFIEINWRFFYKNLSLN